MIGSPAGDTESHAKIRSGREPMTGSRRDLEFARSHGRRGTGPALERLPGTDGAPIASGPGESGPCGLLTPSSRRTLTERRPFRRTPAYRSNRRSLSNWKRRSPIVSALNVL